MHPPLLPAAPICTAEELSHYLEVYSVSQTTLAAALHVAPSTISRYVKGQRPIEYNTQKAIISYFAERQHTHESMLQIKRTLR